MVAGAVRALKHRRFKRALLIVTLSLGLSAPAAAQSGYKCSLSPSLAAAQAHFENLNFARAAELLDRGLGSENSCKSELLKLLVLRAQVAAAREEGAGCKRDFMAALALDPQLQPAGLSPKARRCFLAASAVPESERRLQLTLSLPARAIPKAPVQASLRLEDPLALARVVQLFYRRQGVAGYTELSAPAKPAQQLTVPAASLPEDADGYKLEYFALARGEGGQLTWIGGPEAPLQMEVAPAAQPSITGRWWFWTAIGVAAVGAGVAVYALSQSDSDRLTVNIGVQ